MAQVDKARGGAAAEEPKGPQPASSGAASGGGTTQTQLEESRQARQAVDEKGGEGRVSLDEAGGETGTTEKPLAGVLPAGVVQAGGEEGHEQFVASDPHVFASMPGKEGVEAVGSGAVVPEDAADAMQARAAAGIPEPPKVGPIPNVSLFDTPGGYQAVPAGTTPEQIPENQSSVRPARGNFPTPPFGEAAGAENRQVAGPGSE